MSKGKNILVVDDQVVILALVQRILSRTGYSVVVAQSAAEATAIVEDWGSRPPLDLAIVDIVMRDGDGRELADRLHGLAPDLRVLFMSGFAMTPASNGAPYRQSMILKPFSPETLLGKIEQLLEDK